MRQLAYVLGSLKSVLIAATKCTTTKQLATPTSRQLRTRLYAKNYTLGTFIIARPGFHWTTKVRRTWIHLLKVAYID